MHLLLSVAQKAIDDGEDVIFLYCDGIMPSCISNMDGSKSVCRFCRKRQNAGLRLLAGEYRSRALSDYLDATREILSRYRGLWFTDESFVLIREVE